ncbi:MAG TPA: hypothetical protein VF035_00155 [Longimicrobiales bacterium]
MADEEQVPPPGEDGLDGAGEDIAYEPNEAGDSPELVNRLIPEDIRERYEVHSYRAAALILKEAHPAEFEELMQALRAFTLTEMHPIADPIRT